MPLAAIKAGVVDTGMPIAGLARELIRLGKHPYLAAGAALLPSTEQDEDSFHKIFALVHSKCGVDFSEYKRGTIERRAARRMALREEETLESYLRLLQSDESEARALCEDVLIHVTSFFGEPAVFESLAKESLSRILAGKPKGVPLRVWVAGCSTGEEVYSLAIAILESDAYKKAPRTIQIFGSDVSGKAVEKAPQNLSGAPRVRDFGEAA